MGMRMEEKTARCQHSSAIEARQRFHRDNALEGWWTTEAARTTGAGSSSVWKSSPSQLVPKLVA